jgi:hypothetical protein
MGVKKNTQRIKMTDYQMGEDSGAATPQLNDDVSPLAQAEDTAQTDQSDSKQVPLEALQAERQQRQAIEEKLQAIENHLSLMNTQQQPQEQSPQDDLGSLSDDDVLTVGEAKKFLSQMDNKYQMSIQEMKVQQKYPDYQEVVTKYLPEIIKQKPWLADNLRKTQDYELAYDLAKNSESYRKQHKQQKKNADAEAILRNAEESGSLASVGHTSPVSQASRIKQMSDSDFMKFANGNLGAF